MNVVFLDYDGVVNTPMWDSEGKKCLYGFPTDNKVNNFQAVQWVSEFCLECGYDIVVSSTWRMDSNYKDCMINGGLRRGINILGRTPEVDGEHCRGDEIQKYLNEHPEVNKFLIFDDDSDMGDLMEHLVKCESSRGFGIKEYEEAVRKDRMYDNERMVRHEVE